MVNKNIVKIALGTALLLLVPLVAMKFTDQVKWGPGDFIAAAVLLFGTGLAFELMTRRVGNIAYRMAIAIALGGALLLVWANLAVGLMGSEDNPANVLYDGVLVIGFLGSIAARLRPQGMARVMLAMALAMVLVPVIALSIWKAETGPADLWALGRATSFFAALFIGSALLFRRAEAAGAVSTGGLRSA